MVKAIRLAERALGRVHFGVSPKEQASRAFRRSLFVVQEIKEGEIFTETNIRSIRPGHGLHTRHFEEILGKRATGNITVGTPLTWDLIEGG